MSTCDSGDQWLSARIEDAIRRSSKRACFVGFLDERETALAREIVNRERFSNGLFWGGFEDGERVVFGAFPEYQEPDPEAFPIVGITVSFRSQDTLTHRDFLGAFLAAGVRRETIGDILVEPGRAVLFVRQETAGFLLSQISRIGRVGVRLSEGIQLPLPAGMGFAEFQGVIASPRLDCVTAAATGLSREKAAKLISAGLVTVNHCPQESLSLMIQEGDRLSVRGKGRFIIDRLGPVTKKGRLAIAGRRHL